MNEGPRIEGVRGSSVHGVTLFLYGRRRTWELLLPIHSHPPTSRVVTDRESPLVSWASLLPRRPQHRGFGSSLVRPYPVVDENGNPGCQTVGWHGISGYSVSLLLLPPEAQTKDPRYTEERTPLRGRGVYPPEFSSSGSV